MWTRDAAINPVESARAFTPECPRLTIRPTNGRDMTKHVLLLGVGGVAFYTGLWVVFNDTRFMGPLFALWFVCLLIALVSDAVICPAAKRAVSAFAASLSNEVVQRTPATDPRAQLL